MTEFEQVVNDRQIETVAGLAAEIWRQHYPAIISRQQIDYMVERFQSRDAIRQQIADGYHYALIRQDGEVTGYLAVRCDRDSGELFLSKIYLREQNRGQGAGYAAISYIRHRARATGCRSIWLTVNRMNRVAIDAYERWGFSTTGEIVTDIGKGFVMDDYRMEMRLEAS
jgi:GNAT superfamily N-acetyltransferase